MSSYCKQGPWLAGSVVSCFKSAVEQLWYFNLVVQKQLNVSVFKCALSEEHLEMSSAKMANEETVGGGLVKEVEEGKAADINGNVDSGAGANNVNDQVEIQGMINLR